MRLFYFLLLIPTLAIAAPPACDESDLIAGTGTCTSLTIDTQVDLRGVGGAPLNIVVNGDVTISANILLDGANGVHIITANSVGKNGGPGGNPGGGIAGSFAEPGQTIPEGGFNGQVDAACSSGGGGGSSQMTNGDQGEICTPGGSSVGAPGTAPLNFPGVLSGGFGGGAGGEKFINPDYDLGGGGGGGGAIRIRAQGGTITIANGVLISAKGGKGGDSTNIGGSGGGGGGGTIHLIGDIAVVNNGILDTLGGLGGSVSGAASHGGIGGKGGNGVIRIEDGLNPPQDFSGRQDFSTGIPTSNTSSLKSSISCASLAKKNDENNLAMQMMFGFMLAIIFSFVLKAKSFFSISK